MKIKLQNQNISWWIVLMIFASSFLSQNVNLTLLIIAFLYLFFLNKLKMALNIPGAVTYGLLMILGMTTGLLYIRHYGHSQYVYFKHIYFCGMVALYWFLGYLIVRVKNLSHSCIIHSIALASVLYSVYDIFHVLTSLSRVSEAVLYDYRNAVGGGSFISIIGFYILIFYSKELNYPKLRLGFSYVITVLAILVHFSRTSVIELLILVLFAGVHYNLKRVFRISLLLLSGFFVLYLLMPQMILNFMEKVLYSLTEINFSKTVWTHSDIVNNWRGYEISCAIEQFRASNVWKQLFGSGFGTFVDVKGYAYLVTDEQNLSMLHNGYFTHLIIWGLSGVVLYILWGLQIFSYGKKVNNPQDGCFIRGIAVVLLAVTYFIMGPFFSRAVAVYMFYVSLLYNFSVIEKNSPVGTKIGHDLKKETLSPDGHENNISV